MNRDFTGYMVAVLALCLGCYIAGQCCGCFPEAKEVAAAAGYEAQQMRCVEQYADRASIDACRDRVKKAWATTDAGADAQDGGK